MNHLPSSLAAILASSLLAACGSNATSPDPSAVGGSTVASASVNADAITSCPDAVLFAGNPYFQGTLGGWKTTGQSRLASPPLRSQRMTAAGDTVFIDTQLEVWRTEGEEVVRLAGDEGAATAAYVPSGACSEARFLAVEGVAALPNGNVLVVDRRGNGIVELQDPRGACNAAPYAGNAAATRDADVGGEVAAPGDAIGRGSEATFNGLALPTVDAKGNLFVLDRGNAKVKRVAPDAAHTVSTLVQYSAAADSPLAMTAMNDKLYVAGTTSASEDFLWEIDVASGDRKVLYEGLGLYAIAERNEAAVAITMTNDGTSLLVGTRKGWIFRVHADGTKAVALAGRGRITDYPAGLDLAKPVAAWLLPLEAVSESSGSLLRMGKDLLWAGRNGQGFHVWDVRCT